MGNKLKAFAKSLDDIDEAFHSLYTKNDDGYVFVGVEEADYKVKLDEFRGNNITLRKKNEELSKVAEKFKDVDIEKYQEMQKELESLHDQKLLDKGHVDELITKRTEKMRLEYADKLTKLETRAIEAEKRADKYKGKLDVSIVNEHITSALSDVAVIKKGALGYVLTKGRETWHVDDSDGADRLVAKDYRGDILYDKNGKDPLTVQEWATTLVKDSPFLFESNTGGGAQGSSTLRAGAKVISAQDKEAFSRNLEDIAAGKIEVV